MGSLLVFRPRWNEHDHHLDLDGHVQRRKAKCAKSLVHLQLGHLDDNLHIFRVFHHCRIRRGHQPPQEGPQESGRNLGKDRKVTPTPVLSALQLHLLASHIFSIIILHSCSLATSHRRRLIHNFHDLYLHNFDRRYIMIQPFNYLRGSNELLSLDDLWTGHDRATPK